MKLQKTASRYRCPTHTLIPHRALEIESLYALRDNTVHLDQWSKELVTQLRDVPADADRATCHDYMIRHSIDDLGVYWEEIANACSAEDDRLTREQVGAWVPSILKILFYVYQMPPRLVDEVLNSDA